LVPHPSTAPQNTIPFWSMSWHVSIWCRISLLKLVIRSLSVWSTWQCIVHPNRSPYLDTGRPWCIATKWCTNLIDIAKSNDYSLTKKDDGKVLYHWGGLIKATP
jgi:hypothetical protein